MAFPSQFLILANVITRRIKSFNHRSHAPRLHRVLGISTTAKDKCLFSFSAVLMRRNLRWQSQGAQHAFAIDVVISLLSPPKRGNFRRMIEIVLIGTFGALALLGLLSEWRRSKGLSHPFEKSEPTGAEYEFLREE